MSDIIETVVITVNGEHVRVNKSELDDENSIYHGKTANKTETANQDDPSLPGVIVGLPPEIIVPPAPSAPNFAPVENPAPSGPVPPTIPSPGALLVTKKGSKFVVVNGTAPFDPVTDNDNIDAKGYKTEQEAYDAIKSLPQNVPAV